MAQTTFPGNMSISGTFDVKKNIPLDSRLVVNSVDNLTDGTITSPYQGMVVNIAGTGNLYVLTTKTIAQSHTLSNWRKVNGDGTSKDEENTTINSSEFDSKSPLVLTSAEAEAIGEKFGIGEIVWDTDTKRHYVVRTKKNAINNDVYCLTPLEPMTLTTQQWLNIDDDYIPREGEIIIYTDYKSVTNVNGTTNIPSFKVGDGVNEPKKLPFVNYIGQTEHTITVFGKTFNGTEDVVVDSLNHKLTIGDKEFDGSADVSVNVFDGTYQTIDSH